MMKGHSMKKSTTDLLAIALIFVGLIVFSASPIECGRDDPAARLSGEWIVAGKYGEGDGDAVFNSDMTYTLKEIHADGTAVTHKGEYRIDSSAEPCAIDMCVGKFSNAGSEWVTTFGILRFISEDKAEIHFDPSGKRPGSFDGTPAENIHALSRKK